MAALSIKDIELTGDPIVDAVGRDEFMADRYKIKFDLIKLSSGERILRLTEPQSGLTLKKKLAPADAVVRQKEQLLRAFEAALARVELAAWRFWVSAVR